MAYCRVGGVKNIPIDVRTIIGCDEVAEIIDKTGRSSLPGQIRANLGCRICGRADTILSQIILDNRDANKLIPKDAQGRFPLDDGRLLQGYWFEDSVWEPRGHRE